MAYRAQFLLDWTSNVVRWIDQTLVLPPVEFEIFAVLFDAFGPLTWTDLRRKVFGKLGEASISLATIRRRIYRIRHILEEQHFPIIIRAVPPQRFELVPIY